MANTKFEIWLEKANKERKDYWVNKYSYKEYEPLVYTKGRKFIKIYDDGSVWGFVCMFDGIYKNSPVKVGDLMKASSFTAPAKHARGNIFEETAQWNFWGPCYLK